MPLSSRPGGLPLRAYVAVLVVFFVTIGLAGGFYATTLADNSARTSAYNADANQATSAAHELDVEIPQYAQAVKSGSTNPAFVAAVSAPPTAGALSYGGLGTGDKGHFDVLNEDGVDLDTSLNHLDGGYASAPWFATSKKHFVMAGPYYDPAIKAETLVFAAPIGHGGVFVALADVAPLANILGQLFAGSEGYQFMVTTANGRAVISSAVDPAKWNGASLTSTAFYRSGNSQIRPGLGGQDDVVAETTVMPYTHWRIYALVPSATALTGAHSDRNREFLFIVIGLLLSFGGVVALFRAITRPLNRLRHGVVAAAASPAHAVDVEVVGPSELTTVGRGVNALIAAVRSELAEREAAEKAYRTLFGANPVPMWVYEAATRRFLEVNDAAVMRYGYSRAEFLTLTTDAIGATSEMDEQAPLIEGRDPVNNAGPYVNVTKSGEQFSVLITSRALDFSDVAARLVVAEDVSEQEKTRRVLDQTRRLESLGQLAGGVAHDFNNILSVIETFASFVADSVLPEEVATRSGDAEYWEAVGEDVAQIRRAAARAAELTRRLLTFAAKEVSVPRPLDVEAVIHDATGLLERSLGEHVILVSTVHIGTSPIVADPGQLEQAIVNLAINARDAMPEGGTLTIEAENVLVDETFAESGGSIPEGDYVSLRLSDTGIGMSPEVVERVFEPFYTTKPAGEGTGLGLASVYGFVNSLGGHIQVFSRPGLGTTVAILLPASTQPATEFFEEPLAPLDLSGQGETILVAEDEDQVREGVTRILTRNGYVVMPAASGAEALALMEAHEGHIDMLLTDVIMPKMLGRELAQAVLVARPGIKVLFMSGYAAPILTSTHTVNGEFVLLEKPFGQIGLLAKVRQVLESPPPPHAQEQDPDLSP